MKLSNLTRLRISPLYFLRKLSQMGTMTLAPKLSTPWCTRGAECPPRMMISGLNLAPFSMRKSMARPELRATVSVRSGWFRPPQAALMSSAKASGVSLIPCLRVSWEFTAPKSPVAMAELPPR